MSGVTNNTTDSQDQEDSWWPGQLIGADYPPNVKYEMGKLRREHYLAAAVTHNCRDILSPNHYPSPR